MKTYGYYSRLDFSRQEIRGSVTASNLSEAIELLAKQKRLSIDDFFELYTVIQLNNSEKTLGHWNYLVDLHYNKRINNNMKTINNISLSLSRRSSRLHSLLPDDSGNNVIRS